MAGQIILDTNVLLLLVAGLTDRRIIAKHKNLSSFAIADFDVLQKTIRDFQSVTTTSHVLAEASNLLGQHRDPERTWLFETLKWLIEERLEERPISSREAAQRPEFLRLGLTDGGLLESIAPGTKALTADLDLYLAILNFQSDGAINFNHLLYSDG